MTKNPTHERSHWSRRKLHCKCPSQEEKERKPPKERTVKPSRTGLCKSGESTHGPTTKSRNAATKGYNKRIYTTGKGNVWSKKWKQKGIENKSQHVWPHHAWTKKLHIRVWRYIQEPKILRGKGGLFSKNDQCTQGSTGYQMYQTTDADRAAIPSRYGPIIVPNNFADMFFEKAVIEVLGGTEIEPSTQTHQTTKII